MNFKILKFGLLVFLVCACKHNEDFSQESDINSQNIEFKNSEGVLVPENELRRNLGEIKKGKLIRKEFVFKNTGNEVVELLEYSASCNCSDLILSKFEIAPKDTVSIKMLIDTKDKFAGNQKVTSIGSIQKTV